VILELPQPSSMIRALFEVAEYETRLEMEIPLELDLVPEVAVEISPSPVLARAGDEGMIAVRITNAGRAPLPVSISIAEDGGWGWPADGREEEVAGEGETTVGLAYRVPADAPAGDSSASILVRHAEDADVQAVTLRVLDARIEGDPRVGVVHTYDDSLENALATLGVTRERISPLFLTSGDLSVYDVIFLDLRAYLERPELVPANQRLLEWARAGGTLVVLYNKLFEWNPGPPEHPGEGFGPYPLVLTHARVTDETAPVTLLAPDHPLLAFPNQLGPGDFEGWIQERGLYFPTTYDERYTELVSCADPGEEQLTGSLLHTRLGEGHYVYTSLVWYRQWRIGQPGAYRFLANALSLPAAPWPR
jgi:hypothetical protein